MTRPQNFSLAKAFSCAAAGIAYAFRTQRNLKVQAAFAAAAVALGIAFRISPPEWCAIVLCIMAVFSLEIVNTAVESAVDLASPEWHELAGRAKDCAAGAVYVSALGSLVIAGIIFIPRMLALAGIL